MINKIHKHNLFYHLQKLQNELREISPVCCVHLMLKTFQKRTTKQKMHHDELATPHHQLEREQ